MGRYHAADVLLPPGLVSLSRVVLAVLFPLVVDDAGWAIGVLAAAALSDVVDGWLARRFGWATPTGAVVDGVTDKLFVATVAVTLLVHRYLGVWEVLLLATREIGEAPLVVWWAAHWDRRRLKAEDPKANAWGKAATVLQFVAVVLAIWGDRRADAAIWSAAAVGALAAVLYWRRELSTFSTSRAGKT